jgi:hypothetical protein
MATQNRRRSAGRRHAHASRAHELVAFLQDVALGKRTASARDVDAAAKELGEYLPDLESERVRQH